MDYTPMRPASAENLWHAYRDDYLLLLMLRDSPEKMRVYECRAEVRLHVEHDSPAPRSCQWGTCIWARLIPLYVRTLKSHAAYIMEQDAPTELKMDAVARLQSEIAKIERDNSQWEHLDLTIPTALYLLEKEG